MRSSYLTDNTLKTKEDQGRWRRRVILLFWIGGYLYMLPMMREKDSWIIELAYWLDADIFLNPQWPSNTY